MTRTQLERIAKRITKMGFHPLLGESDWGGFLQLYVSAEHGDGAADYWGTDREPYPTIHPKLEALADKLGCYWEWQNPGCIALTE